MTGSDRIDLGTTHLWARRAGDGGASPLIVPGAVVDEDLERLAETRPVLFYDSRNRGRSDRVDDPAQLGFWAEVADAEAVRASAGFERASWLGWSYLAGVVVQHALAHPVRVDRLILVAPIGASSGAGSQLVVDAPVGGLARLDQLRAEGIDRSDPVRFCEAWHEVYDPLQVFDSTSLAVRRSRPCLHPNESPGRVPAALAHVFVDLGIYDWRAELARLEIPTLVVHGGADDSNEDAATEWVLSMPDARLLVLDGVRRWPWLEAPVSFFEAIDRFLGGAWPADARR